MKSNPSIPVWDIFIRIFHWSLVICFITAYFTSEDDNPLHIYAGYAVLGLISLRVIWGFIGSQHAKFKDFVFQPHYVMTYAKSLLVKKPKHFLGHNPLGGYMVIALLISLFAVSLSGLKLYAVEENKGPLAQQSSIQLIQSAHAEEEEEEKNQNPNIHFWKELHEATVNITLFLIALHIAGVVISSKLHRENLVKAMITGKKNHNEN